MLATVIAFNVLIAQYCNFTNGEAEHIVLASKRRWFEKKTRTWSSIRLTLLTTSKIRTQYFTLELCLICLFFLHSESYSIEECLLKIIHKVNRDEEGYLRKTFKKKKKFFFSFHIYSIYLLCRCWSEYVCCCQILE